MATHLLPVFLFVCFQTAVGAAASGGDFMSDLFNKLAMRRKGWRTLLYQMRLNTRMVVIGFA